MTGSWETRLASCQLVPIRLCVIVCGVLQSMMPQSRLAKWTRSAQDTNRWTEIFFGVTIAYSLSAWKGFVGEVSIISPCQRWLVTAREFPRNVVFLSPRHAYKWYFEPRTHEHTQGRACLLKEETNSFAKKLLTAKLSRVTWQYNLEPYFCTMHVNQARDTALNLIKGLIQMLHECIHLQYYMSTRICDPPVPIRPASFLNYYPRLSRANYRMPPQVQNSNANR